MRERPSEISREQQLQKTMREIAVLTGGGSRDADVPPGEVPLMAPPPHPIAPNVPEFAPEPAGILQVFEDAIEANPVPKVVGIQKWSLVQIKDMKSDSYGVVFTVADIQGDQIHGFMFQPGRGRVYITSERSACELVGQGKVASRQPCSPEWVHKYPHATL